MSTPTAATLVLGLGLVFLAAPKALAQEDAGKPAIVRPGDLRFETMYNGTRQANAVGDITKAGPYAVRTVLPAGLRIPPHTHPEARTVLVMSGVLWVAFGADFDETTLAALPAGSVFIEPPGQPHFTWAKDGDVVLHVTGQGPTATTWMKAGRAPGPEPVVKGEGHASQHVNAASARCTRCSSTR